MMRMNSVARLNKFGYTITLYSFHLLYIRCLLEKWRNRKHGMEGGGGEGLQ